jgi:hypothetical protein
MTPPPTCAGCRWWRQLPTDGECTVRGRLHAAGLGFIYPRQCGTDPGCHDFTPAPPATPAAEE